MSISPQNSIQTPIIGYHRTPLAQKFGIPRQPNLVTVPSRIEIIAPYNVAEAFDGITAFSHLWITWHAHHNHHNKSQNTQKQHTFKPKVRPPRLGGNTKLGVFATRSTYRPSQLGLSVVKLTEVDILNNEVILHIQGADMVDGTPIIDIKPYIAYSDAIIDSTGSFNTNQSSNPSNVTLEKPNLKLVQFSHQAQTQLDALIEQSASVQPNRTSAQSVPSSKFTTDNLICEDIDIICQLIAQDPRPAYRQDDTTQVFVMRYKKYDIHFKMNNDYEMVIVSITSLV